MRFLRFVPVMLLATVALVPSTTRAVRSADTPLTVVRMATIGQDANAEGFFATELGIFKKYGLDVQITIVRRGGGAAIAGIVAGGAADIGEGDIVSLAAAHEHGVPLVLIFPSALSRASAPTTEIVVANNSPIQSAKDLEGKTVALTSLQGPSRVATDAWIDGNGAALDKVQFVELPPITMGNALTQGTVAAAVISEPTLTASKACCRVLANNFERVGKEWLLTGYYASPDWLAKNPDVAKRFVAAIKETAQWANKPANRPQSGVYLDKYTPFPPELLSKMTRAQYGESLSLGTIQPILDDAYRYHALKTPVAAKDIISPAFAP